MAQKTKKKAMYDPEHPFDGPLPDRIAVMPIKSTVIFPTGATGLQVGYPPNVAVLGLNPGGPLCVALVATEEEDEEELNPSALEKVGVLARVLNRLNLPGGLIQATIQGLIRIRLENVRLEDGHYTALPRLVEETGISDEAAEPLVEKILTTLGGIGAKIERLEDVPRILRRNFGDPGRFADLVATLAHFSVADKDAVLQRLDVGERLEYVHQVLDTEWDRIREQESRGGRARGGGGDRARTASRGPRNRGAEIRKRIAALQAELGELDPTEKAALEFLRRIDRAQLPTRVASIARREAERLRTMPPISPEAAELRAYIEVVLDLPWDRLSDKRELELEAVAKALEQTHLGLEDVKRRILEFLSVALLRGQVSGYVPCIVGPPGVGKRSIAQSIADGLGRPLVRVELGGRGESQLVGRRRTRAGAHAGKLISAYRDAGIRDPVYLLEEMDEVGLGNVEGDPIEAMEEFLDPDNRREFIDHYLDIPFDASDTIFIATALDFTRIPRSLREFLIEVRIAGYTPEEKVEIARDALLPRLVQAHGLTKSEVRFGEDDLVFLTRGYARDAGLGNLRRALSALLRHIAHAKATSSGKRWTITREMMEEVLGVPRYTNTEAESAPEIGVVTGLAWTASGGELMFIEALKMPGTGRLIITGMLGDVMRESVNAAYSYVRSRADMLGISDSSFGETDVHIHFPVGATPKDGPSAGAAVTLAIASSLSDRAVRHDIAMTGEVTLRGRILEVGGLKEKTLAAYRAGLREMILPTGNERDLRDVPEDVRDGMTFHFVERMEEVFELCLLEKPKNRRRRGPKGGSAGGRERQAAAEAAVDEEESGP